MERWRTALPVAVMLVGCSLLATARSKGTSPPTAPATLPPDDIRITPIVRVVQKVGDAVVNIYSDIQVEDRYYSFWLGPQRRTLKTTSLGSGVIIDPAGFVVTNAHVLTASLGENLQIDKVSPKVRLRDGKKFDARVLSLDYSNDLAVLQILAPGPFPSVALATSSDLMIGETAVAVGNPYGYENSVTAGIISGTGKTLTLPSGQQFKDFIQTDASLNAGNSGGPLFNIKGDLIGINELIARDPEHGWRAEGIGIAIPSDRVKKLLLEKLLHPRAIRGFDPGLQIADGPDGRPHIVAVAEDGPAEQAHLEADDVIQSVDGERVDNSIQFFTHLLSTDRGAGDVVEIGVSRNGRARTAKVELRAASRVDDVAWDRLGVQVSDDRTYAGAYVERVRSNSPAAAIELLPGDAIRQIASYAIDDTQSLIAALRRVRRGTQVKIVVERTSEGTSYEGTIKVN
jgi:S1-C subfamily serine protease